MEEWKDIKGYKGMYQVSNKGNVKSIKFTEQRILKPDFSRGYQRVTLSKNNTQKRYFVHALVAEAFKGITANYPVTVIDHINENPKDNRPENLQLLSHRENIIKGRPNKTGFPGVYENYGKYRSRIVIKGIKKDLGNFDTPKQAHAAYKKELIQITQNH